MSPNSKDTITDGSDNLLKYREYDKYVLKCLNDLDAPTHKNIIKDNVADILNLTDDARKQLMPNKNYSSHDDRVDWSLVYLKQAELIENAGRGIYQVTDFGKKFLSENPIFDFKMMKEKTPFLKNRKTKNKSTPQNDNYDSDNNDIKLSTQEYYEEIELEILNKLKSLESQNTVDKGIKFEDICLDLLETMGYGDKDRTGGACDRGIDGVLTLDYFGFDRIGVQCKCYGSDNKIKDKEITQFYHGLKIGNMNKGIFITTTDFYPQAKQVVEEIKDIKIILINGSKLATLMREYEVGVEVIEVNYIYNIVI